MLTQEAKKKIWDELRKLHTSNKQAYESAKYPENKGSRPPYFAAQYELYDFVARVIDSDSIPSRLPHDHFKTLVHNAEREISYGTADVNKAQYNEGFLVAAKTVDRLIEKYKYFS